MQKLEYTDYDRLRDVGTENREYEQELIDAAKQKWDYTSNDGWNKAQKYANIMSLMLGGSGGTQTTEKPYYTNTAGNILGGLTSGIGTLSGLSGATSGIKSLLSLF